MSLEIQVLKRWCHPEFGGDRQSVRRFDNLSDAEKHFNEQKKNDCHYHHTLISIVEIHETTQEDR